MDTDYSSDDATSPTNAAREVAARNETSDQFIDRMIREGASPQAAEQAAVAHSEFEEKQLLPGELLPGWTARRWQEMTFVMLGCFLAELIGVVLTAPAFHPTETNTHGMLWGVLFLATSLPIMLLMVGARMAMTAKMVREIRHGYTTLRWLAGNPTEVRDSRGRVIPPDDKRLTSSAKYMHSLILIGSVCAVVSPAIWILRLVIH
jgi:hypothetical protein